MSVVFSALPNYYFAHYISIIQTKIRLSHISQPVMQMALSNNDGECHQTNIARKILVHDQSQIEYYNQITNNLVRQVLYITLLSLYSPYRMVHCPRQSLRDICVSIVIWDASIIPGW